MKDMNLVDSLFQKKFNTFDVMFVFSIAQLLLGGFYLTGIVLIVVFAIASNSIDAWYEKDKARRDNSDQWGHE